MRLAVRKLAVRSAQAAGNRGDAAQCRKLLTDAQASGSGLYAARRAAEWLSDMEQ